MAGCRAGILTSTSMAHRARRLPKWRGSMWHRRKPAVDESEQSFRLVCSFAADVGQIGHSAQLLQLLADQLGDRFPVELYASVRKSARNSGDERSGPFRRD